MFDKVTLLFEILKTSALLYEVNWKGPNHIGTVLERFNAAAARDFLNDDWKSSAELIEEWPEPAATMARAYLDHIYTGSAEPEWLLKAEAANKADQSE